MHIGRMPMNIKAEIEVMHIQAKENQRWPESHQKPVRDT